MKPANGRLIAASEPVLSLIEQFFSLPEFSHIPNPEHAIKLFETKIAPLTRTLTYIYENYTR
ncbi:MAG: hypothetical protein IJA28_03920, partial [Coprobacter sp.]|nr:hypothetical protein [Coprobacter sp.]